MILAFLISISFAQTVEQLKSDPGIRYYMAECGYTPRNHKLFLDAATQEQIDCMESKKPALQAIITKKQQKRSKFNNAKKNIKQRDCETLNGFSKDVCYYLKGRE